MSNNIPENPTPRSDDEAAGLLMLFSTQSKKQITSTEIGNVPTAAGTTDTPLEAHITSANVEVPKTEKGISSSKSMSTSLPSTTETAISTVAVTNPTLNKQKIDNSGQSSISSSGTHISHTDMRRRGSSFHENINPSRVDSVMRSPGPASAALASGNSSNKAIVAAAALAAAAATPIPIVHKPLLNSETLNMTNAALIKTEPEEVKMEGSSSNVSIERLNGEGETVSVMDETEPEDVEDQMKVDTKSSKVEETAVIDKLPPYAVGPDAGIIGCVCGYDHDDGLTIQCDKCFRWQHLVCMGFDSITDTPDDFQCNLCNKNMKVDAAKARRTQEAYLKEERAKGRKIPYSTEPEKDAAKNIGAPQFKKKKPDDNVEITGTQKYQTLYYPINYFVYKSSIIKSLFNQLPEILMKDKSILKIERTALSKLVLKSSNLNIKSANENKSKFTGISKLGLYPTTALEESTCVSLVSGEIDTKENYMMDKVNKYWLLGCPKPHVIAHSDLPIIIDQRGLGNYTRFIRKSCKPNCVMKTILIGKSEISMGVFTTREIKPDQELTLGWEWDVSHPMLKMINNNETFDNLDADSKVTLINSIQSILDLTDCACASASDCMINKVKKSTAYLQRNTRKNNISNLTPTPNQKHVPIEERLETRNKIILNNIQKDAMNDDIIADTNLVNEESGDSAISDRTVNLKFKPRSKNTLYNLHILPKQFEVLKKYMVSEEAKKQGAGVVTLKENELMPIPISVNQKVLQTLESVGAEKTAALSSNISNKVSGDVKPEERPKVVKKFSLADYKKKKTG